MNYAYVNTAATVAATTTFNPKTSHRSEETVAPSNEMLPGPLCASFCKAGLFLHSL